VQLSSNSSALRAFARIGWRRAAAEPLATAARGGLNVLALGIFWAFWRATPLAELRRPELTPERLIWYLAVTEWIVFSTGIPYREIEDDIRSGALATNLTRPIDYARACCAQWCGGIAFRLPIFALVGFVAALGLSGTVPIDPAMLLAGLASVLLALAILHLCHLMIGLATIWTGSAAPLHWIWQKGLFVLGGLIIPLSLYPAPFRRFAENSPFAAMLSAPASLALDPSPGHAIAVLRLQLIWLIVLAGMAWLTDRAAIARFLERGT